MVVLPKSFSCNPCGKVFESKFKFRSHLIYIRATKKLHQCKTCLLRFSKKKTLDIHENLHSEKQDDSSAPKLHKCKACSRTFIKSSALHQHLEIHIRNTDYKCDKCLKRFTDKSDLKVHTKKKHSNDDQINCDHCLCIFSGETQLNRHVLRVHIGFDPQGCKKCSNFTEEDYFSQMKDFV